MKAKERIVALLKVSSRYLSAWEIEDITNVWFVYIHLKDLEEEGIVESNWLDEQAPFPRKRVYRLK